MEIKKEKKEINPGSRTGGMEGKGPAPMLPSFPGASRCSSIGRVGIVRSAGSGHLLLAWRSRDRGEGLIEGPRSCGGFRGFGSQTSGLGGWPVKLQPSRSCAAVLLVLLLWLVDAELFPWRRNETRDQRSTTNPRAKRVESSRDELQFPQQEGERSCVCVDVRHGILRPAWERTRRCS
jgi:hypothetical protein